LGGLYFINIRYVSSAPRAMAALVAGAVIIGVLEIILYGSAVSFFKAQQVQTSACELAGESTHPEARRGADPTVIHKAITACMIEAGYEWDGKHRHCRDAPIATNPFCYLPTDSMDRTITNIQLSFE
jgi:hypothetical protein